MPGAIKAAARRSGSGGCGSTGMQLASFQAGSSTTCVRASSGSISACSISPAASAHSDWTVMGGAPIAKAPLTTAGWSASTKGPICGDRG